MGIINFNWKDPSHWTHVEYDVVHLFLVACYAVLLFIAIFMFVRYRYNSRYFMVSFLAGTLLRFVFFAMQPFVIEGVLSVANALNFIMNTLPSFLFFSSYMMLLFFWGEIYRTNESFKRRGLTKQIFIVFTVINLIMYITIITLYLLDLFLGRKEESGVSQPTTIYERTVMVFAGIIYIVVSVGFFLYGYYTFRYGYYDNSGLPMKRTVERRKLLRKVGTITLIGMTCFMIRGGITIWAAFDSNMAWWWWLDGVYYFLLEIVPVLLMLFAYVTPRRFKQPSFKASVSPDNTATSPLITDD